MQKDTFVEIQNAFAKFTDTGEESLIKNFTREEIDNALVRLHRNKGMASYEAMVNRSEKLKEKERGKREQIEKWKDRIIGFVFGLILGYLLNLLNA